MTKKTKNSPVPFPLFAVRNGSMALSRHLKVRHLERARLASLALSNNCYIWSKQEPQGTPAGRPAFPRFVPPVCRLQYLSSSVLFLLGWTRRNASVMLFNRGVKTCPFYQIPLRSGGISKRSEVLVPADAHLHLPSFACATVAPSL